MEKAQKGQVVKIHLVGSTAEGNQFIDSHQEGAITFCLGEGGMLPAVENAIEGMGQGDKKKISLTADQAFGQPRKDLIITVPRDRLPKEAKVGDNYAIDAGGQDVNFKLLELKDNKATLDGNHPLAGQNLEIEIELLSIEKS